MRKVSVGILTLAGAAVLLISFLSANLGYRFYAHNLHRFYNCDWVLPRAA